MTRDRIIFSGFLFRATCLGAQHHVQQFEVPQSAQVPQQPHSSQSTQPLSVPQFCKPVVKIRCADAWLVVSQTPRPKHPDWQFEPLLPSFEKLVSWLEQDDRNHWTIAKLDTAGQRRSARVVLLKEALTPAQLSLTQGEGASQLSQMVLHAAKSSLASLNASFAGMSFQEKCLVLEKLIELREDLADLQAKNASSKEPDHPDLPWAD